MWQVCCLASYKRKTWMYPEIHPRYVFLVIDSYFSKMPKSPIVVFSAALISLVGSNLK